MLKKILESDQYVFDLINQSWSNPLMDAVMPFFRNQFTWVPVYFFLILFAYFNFRKSMIPWIAFFLLTFALTDMISTQIIKEIVQRPRPCWNDLTSDHVRMLIPCSPAYSFVSSHAANHMGMAIFIFGTLYPLFGKKLRIVFIWALLVCLAQVYVGAHFPGDVLGGALLGWVTGYCTMTLFNKYYPLQYEKREDKP
jgi:membrane-associated phospholipid phosphatase